MPATPQQQAVLDAVRDRPDNLAVDAVAGAGKTTTIVAGTREARGRTGFAAFNAHIADELRSRLGGSAAATTLHGLGFGCLKAARPAIALDERKTQKCLERIVPELHREGRGRWAGRKFLGDEWAGLPDAVAVCKQQNLFPDEDRRAVEDACWRQGVQFPAARLRGRFFEVVQAALADALDDPRACDFDDMVWMPVRLDAVRPQFDTLFVDEVQDLNPAQQELALMSGDRAVVVGDPRQAIMGFAGADERGFDTLRGLLAGGGRGCLDLPLSCCFRCPTSHLDLARLLVPHVEARPGAPAGVAADLRPGELAAAVAPGDMVLCRSRAPLMSLAMRLIGQGRPVMVRGRKVGKDLLALVDRLKPASPAELLYKLDRWERDQVEKLDAADAPEEAFEAVEDRAASLRALATAAETVADLRGRIEGLFDDLTPERAVLLSTVHRAKGLEADRVFLHEPGLMPGRGGGQELNVLYVALTRAKQALYFADGETRRKDPFDAWVRKVAEGHTRKDLTEYPQQETTRAAV